MLSSNSEPGSCTRTLVVIYVMMSYHIAIDLHNVVYVRLTQLAQAQVVRAQTKAVLFHTWLYKKIKPCSGDALLEQLGHNVARAFWETSFASLMGAIG